MTTRLSTDALADIQRFIISGYGKLPSAVYLSLRIHDGRKAQSWLASLIPTITTARPWPTDADGKQQRERTAVNVAFTATGLVALGAPDEVCCTFPPEWRDGMATPARSAILGDTEESAPERWELGGPAQPPIHVLLLLHGVTSDDVEQELVRQRGLIDRSAGGVSEIDGALQRGDRPTDREPFGFRDGVSQPAIAGLSGDGVPTGEFILGYENHFQTAPPTPVVPAALDVAGRLPPVRNPHLAAENLRDLGANGTFVVYRKLQQDVAGFWQYMRREGRRATGTDTAASTMWMAARCVGRWPSGAPLAMTPEFDDPALGDRNDFVYGPDADGFACPLGAHVRRTHPRDVIPPYPREQSLSMSEAHRLLRRARVYGPPLVDPRLLTEPISPEHAAALANLADDGVARGIHFFSVNASIARQFEFVQQTWCNNPRFGGLHDNKDPISGDNARSDEPASHMSVSRRSAAFRSSPLPRFVTVRGGGYFFMPGVRALEFLSTFRVPAG